MTLKYTVVCGKRYPEGDLNVQFTAPCVSLEAAFDCIDNHLVGYPEQLIEVRFGTTVYTLDYNAGQHRPLLS